MDRETAAEWLFTVVATLPLATLLGTLVGGPRWVRWTGFFLVAASPCAYVLVVAEPYRRLGLFREEVRRVVAFLALAWVAGTAGLAVVVLLGTVGAVTPFVPLLTLGAALLGAGAVATRVDTDRVRRVVLGSVAVQVAVVAVVGAPGSPVPVLVGWVGVALAPLVGVGVGGGVALRE